MKSNKIQSIIQKSLQHIYSTHVPLCKIVHLIAEHKGNAYFVGGVVRDILLDHPVKDIDIEVHGLSEDALSAILKQFGPVDMVGQSFGVLKIHGLNVDWSLPRKDSAGRKPQVLIDPHMSIAEACRRRDLTINAMGIHAITGELQDPFDGRRDLENRILRSPDISLFGQDPLRFFRVMQFIARFDMRPDEQLDALCRHMDIAHVSRERIEQEFAKMMLRSQRPSLGIRWLHDIGRLNEVLPELAATIGVPQSKHWHPEGDVFEHSLQSLDAAAQLTYASDQDKLVLIYAALCHDFGKISTTTHDGQEIHSYGHEQEGVPMAKKLLRRITDNRLLQNRVVTLIRWHMVPMQLLENHATLNAYKRLALRLAPYENMANLAKLVLADKRGRNPHGHEPLTTEMLDVEAFLKRAEQANVVYAKEPPLLLGRDFLDVVQPGPQLGRLVKKAYQLQMEGITDKQILKQMALSTQDDEVSKS